MEQLSLTSQDLMDPEAYAQVRTSYRQKMIQHKRHRRVSIGPLVTVFFEDKKTLIYQIQEMLYAEGGGSDQLKEELMAYGPLLPGPGELVITMMIEVPDLKERQETLRKLGGVEKSLVLTIGGEAIQAQEAHQDGVERTTADGKTSAVHFLRFTLPEKLIKKFHQAEISLRFIHPHYPYQAILSPETQELLGEDLKMREGNFL